MDFEEQFNSRQFNQQLNHHLNQQRVKHIVSSYQLAGTEDVDSFEQYLADLLHAYPSALVELALVETLVDCWVRLPVVRGCEFLAIAHDYLQDWDDRRHPRSREQPIAHTIAPEQFRQITGLDPTPVFGPTRLHRQSASRS
jgi:hypothetical protein